MRRLAISIVAIALSACGSSVGGGGNGGSSTHASTTSASSTTSSATTTSGTGGATPDGGPCGAAYIEVKGGGEDETLTAGCFSQAQNQVLDGPTALLQSGALNVVTLSACQTSGVATPSIVFRLGNGIVAPGELVMAGKSYTVGSGSLSPEIRFTDAQGAVWSATEGTLNFTGMEAGIVSGDYTASLALPPDAGVPTVKMVSGGFRTCRVESIVP
jgi:hypothetical protein